ncbi:MAG: hypothetical protein IJ553_06105 [Alloprevotella sp.]|nr:hypothetical protein [Alloprevotella sp.]
MRKVFFLTALLWLGWLRVSADDLDGLILFFDDGTSVVYLLAEEPKISFTTDELLIQTSERSDSWPLEEVRRYVLAENVATGISETNASSLSYTWTGNVLTVNDLRPKERVVVYYQSGKKVAEVCAEHYGNVRIKLPEQAGVYLVHTSKGNYKIIK